MILHFIATTAPYKSMPHRRGMPVTPSGISTTVGQIGLIGGPLLMIIMKQFSYSLPYFFCMLVLLISGAVPLISQLQFKSDKQTNINYNLKKSPSLIYTIALSLIWPTIAVFNITAPILAKSQFNSINVAGVMEFLIGSAMALIGFFHITTIRYLNHYKRISYVYTSLIASASLIFLFPYSLKTIFISTFVIGLSFGYLRIELRAFLSQKFSSEQAGEIVACANSWSGPLVLIYCLLFYFESGFRNAQEISIVFPLSFIIAASIISFLLVFDSKPIEGNAQ
jgi:hypothetical protein